MEQRDIELIERHKGSDPKLSALFDEHVSFERMLEKFNNKPYLTPMEEVEKKNLQKRKLAGRDLIEAILRSYRKQDSKS